jgi:hypothetical protein
MDTIFQLPLFAVALFQACLLLLLLTPSNAIRLPVARLIKASTVGAAANSVSLTVAVVLGGLTVSAVVELTRTAERATRADTREWVRAEEGRRGGE